MENVWDRDNWFEIEKHIVPTGPRSFGVDMQAICSGRVNLERMLVQRLAIEAMREKQISPGEFMQTAFSLARELKRPISIGSVGCGDAQREKRLASQRFVKVVKGCEVDETSETTVDRADGVKVFGLKDMDAEEACDLVLDYFDGVDLLFFGDSLHHTPDPALYLRRATEITDHWIVISEPFHMDYDAVTPEAGYLMDSTPYLKSLLGETGHKAWINWAVLQGWAPAYVKLIPFPESSVMDDELERVYVVLEKRGGVKPYTCPEDDESVEGVFGCWPLCLLNDEERQAVSSHFNENESLERSLESFLAAFDLSEYTSLNPFASILDDVHERMKDQELIERMQKAELVFKVYYILKEKFNIDLFRRILASSKSSFKPRQQWSFERNADGFNSFHPQNYVDSMRRIRQVLDHRRYPNINKQTITDLLKGDLERLRDPKKTVFLAMLSYIKSHGQKPNVACFEAGSVFGSDHLCAQMALNAELAEEVVGLELNHTNEVANPPNRGGVCVEAIECAGVDENTVLDRFSEVVKGKDMVVFYDGLQHLPDPFEGVKRAYEALTPGGKLFVISPFMFEGDEATLRSLWLMNRTAYPDSRLTLEDQEIWVNWLIFQGAKLEFAKMNGGTYFSDNLMRATVVFEKPTEREYVVKPWTFFDDKDFDMDRSAEDQGVDYMDMWPYSGLEDEDKTRLRSILGDDLNGLPLRLLRGEIAYRLVYESLEEDEKEDFGNDKQGFLNGFAESHGHYELLEKFRAKFGTDPEMDQRFANSAMIALTCRVLKEFYSIDIEDYVYRDLQWQPWKYWQFKDDCSADYQDMIEVTKGPAADFVKMLAMRVLGPTRG